MYSKVVHPPSRVNRGPFRLLTSPSRIIPHCLLVFRSAAWLTYCHTGFLDIVPHRAYGHLIYVNPFSWWEFKACREPFPTWRLGSFLESPCPNSKYKQWLILYHRKTICKWNERVDYINLISFTKCPFPNKDSGMLTFHGHKARIWEQIETSLELWASDRDAHRWRICAVTLYDKGSWSEYTSPVLVCFSRNIAFELEPQNCDCDSKILCLRDSIAKNTTQNMWNVSFWTLLVVWWRQNQWWRRRWPLQMKE